MSQPVWVFVANLGDASPLEHGGFFVYRDAKGVYPPEAEVLVLDDETDDPHYSAYRIVLEPCTYFDGVLSDNKFHPDHPAWFADKDPVHKARHGYDQWSNFCRAAESMGLTPDRLAAKFCSIDPVQLAIAYRAIIGLHGCHEFDQDPLKLRKREARQRYLEKNGAYY